MGQALTPAGIVRITHEWKTLGAGMAKSVRPMLEVTRDGTEREKLENLALTIASAIDECVYMKDVPPLAKQYRETIAAIREIDGGDDGDDELEALLAGSSKTRQARAG